MITRSEVLDAIGRDNLAARRGITRQAVDVTVRRGFPSGWYFDVTEMAAAKGISVPLDLFNNMKPAKPAPAEPAHDVR